ncbi:MAG: S8 family serine peptidase [Anaerostipes hadrus]
MDTSPTDSELKLINDSMEKSVKQGSVLLAASGNEANNVSTSCPANNSWTISVGSVQPNPTDRTRYTRSWFSNYGKRLDFVAPGNNINSAWQMERSCH